MLSCSTPLHNIRDGISVFAIGIVIIFFFWGLDGYNYYYQEKLRATMERLFRQVRERHGIKNQDLGVGQPLGSRNPRTRWRRSFFNQSMWYYYVLIILDIALLLAFLSGIIRPLKGS